MPRYRYSESELKKLEKNIVIIADTREQANKHIIDFFNTKKIKYVEDIKLDYGDYSCFIEYNEETKGLISQNIYFDRDIVIERKACIDEIAANMQEQKTIVKDKEVIEYFNKTFGKDYLKKVLKCDYCRFKAELTSINKHGICFRIFVEDKNFHYNLRNHNYVSKYKETALNARIKSFEADFNTTLVPIDKTYMGSEIYNTLKAHVRDTLKKKGFLEDDVKVGVEDGLCDQ